MNRRTFLMASTAALLSRLPATSAAAAPHPAPIAASEVLKSAEQYLGGKYVWGGATPKPGFDCSGYVSWIWRIPRRTTDNIRDMTVPISKDDLKPGDVLNMPYVGKDSHMRLFAGWAKPDRSRVWVYESTGGRGVIKRAINYDNRYKPIRRRNIVSDAAGLPYEVEKPRPEGPRPPPSPGMLRPVYQPGNAALDQ